MILTRSMFDRLTNSNQLSLILIGMSNMGKTYWALKLVELGFQHLHFDDRIAQKLRELLASNGFEGVNGVSQWMGQPYTEGYEDRANMYLQAETEVLDEIRSEFKGVLKNVVVDTTGSFIYLETHSTVKQDGMIVYLQESLQAREEMFRQYVTEPKPVIWGRCFYQNEGEDDQDALERCYSELLEFRAKRYSQLADVILPYEIARDNSLTAEGFLEEIRSRLT